MGEFVFVTPPNGADYDKAELDELMGKLAPLLAEYSGCSICGEDCEKNREHLPPECSGNRSRLDTIVVDAEASRETGELTFARAESVPFRYRYSLCERCNHRTGLWYASDYRDFVVGVETNLGLTQDGSMCRFTFTGRPSAVAKQMLSIICSVSGPGLANNAPMARTLLLQNKYRAEPEEFRLYAFATDTPGGKQSSFGLAYSKDQGHKHIVAEFTHRPLGWVLAWRSPPIPELTDISGWLNTEYRRVGDFPVSLPKLPSCSPYPLDFRSQEEIHKGT